MERTRDTLLTLGLLGAMVLGLPLLGAWLTGRSPADYLAFPPDPGRVPQATFSWPVFVGLALLIAGVLAGIALRAVESLRRTLPVTSPPRRPLPWWGWAALAAEGIAWVLAWTRFEWFAPLQPHTFTLLWLAYIGVVNALCVARSGTSLLTRRPCLLAALFPASALFWWVFEYLNRFAGNWYYSGPMLDPWPYFWYATVPFSTVLPAVMSTQALICSSPRFKRAFVQVRPLRVPGAARLPMGALLAAGAGLIGIGARPDWCYPLVWVAPLLALVGIRALRGHTHPLQELMTPDWTGPASAALAALVCGTLWEMWNTCSMARWAYSIPYVHRFQIFEMPLLGYAGYLPFGLECAAVTMLVEDLLAGCGRERPALA
jgi:hypothetical protein